MLAEKSRALLQILFLFEATSVAMALASASDAALLAKVNATSGSGGGGFGLLCLLLLLISRLFDVHALLVAVDFDGAFVFALDVLFEPLALTINLDLFLAILHVSAFTLVANLVTPVTACQLLWTLVLAACQFQFGSWTGSCPLATLDVELGKSAVATDPDDLQTLVAFVRVTGFHARMVATLGSRLGASGLAFAAVAASFQWTGSVLHLVTGALASVVAARQTPSALTLTGTGLGHETGPVRSLVSAQASDGDWHLAVGTCQCLDFFAGAAQGTLVGSLPGCGSLLFSCHIHFDFHVVVTGRRAGVSAGRQYLLAQLLAGWAVAKVTGVGQARRVVTVGLGFALGLALGGLGGLFQAARDQDSGLGAVAVDFFGLAAGITASGVAPGGTLVVAAGKRLVAGQVAGSRAGLGITALAIAGMFAARFHALALGVTGEVFLGASDFASLGSATARLLGHLEASSALAAVTSLHANVIAASQRFPAGVAAGGRGFVTGQLVLGLAAGTRPELAEGTGRTRPLVADDLADVMAAFQRPAALVLTLPVGGGALGLFLVALTLAQLDAGPLTRLAFSRVTGLRATVLTAVELATARLAARPVLLVTPAIRRRGVFAVAILLHRFWTGWAWTWMTEDEALVSALRFQRSLASLSARVGQNPRVKGRVLNFAAVASVPDGNLGLLRPALGTRPLEGGGGGGGSVTPRRRRLLLVLLLEDAIVGPLLDAVEVKGAETGLATPHRVVSLQTGNADEAGASAAAEAVPDGLRRPRLVLGLVAGEDAEQDLVAGDVIGPALDALVLGGGGRKGVRILAVFGGQAGQMALQVFVDVFAGFGKRPAAGTAAIVATAAAAHSVPLLVGAILSTSLRPFHGASQVSICTSIL